MYGTTAGGCHRSDTAEVRSAGPIASSLINLACSGATTKNVFRASQGGQAYRGEAPQADQLAAVAASHDVELIALSVGGNDLGFADIITTCATDYIVWYSYCHDDQQDEVDARIDGAMADVGRSVDEIRAVMTSAGYSASDYRIVLQSYPSPSPARPRTVTSRAAGPVPTRAAAPSGTPTPTGPATPSSPSSPTG